MGIALAACAGLPPGADGALSPRATREGILGIAELAPAGLEQGEPLKLVATTSLVADALSKVGGDAIELSQLLPPDADPHGFTATADDLRSAADAHLIVINGLGLEEALLDELRTGAPDTPIVSLSEGITPLALAEADHDAEGDQDASPDHADPHVWFDPIAVMVWADNAAAALGALDPTRAAEYQSRAEAYRAELRELDEWIEGQVETVPSGNRELVTDHLTFGYFAERYGFRMIGAVIPAYSSQAEPSAQQLAALEGTVQAEDVKALFVGRSANPTLIDRIADDLGIPVVPLYTGSLSGEDGPASTYLQFMRYDVRAIVEALS